MLVGCDFFKFQEEESLNSNSNLLPNLRVGLAGSWVRWDTVWSNRDRESCQRSDTVLVIPYDWSYQSLKVSPLGRGLTMWNLNKYPMGRLCISRTKLHLTALKGRDACVVRWAQRNAGETKHLACNGRNLLHSWGTFSRYKSEQCASARLATWVAKRFAPFGLSIGMGFGWMQPGSLPTALFFGAGLKAVTWLILPVVICSSQRLSHACLSISWLYCETANGSLNQL